MLFKEKWAMATDKIVATKLMNVRLHRNVCCLNHLTKNIFNLIKLFREVEHYDRARLTL